MNQRSLYVDERPNYATNLFPSPRSIQEIAHNGLRDGVRAGHKNQMLVAPTGGGKTYIGLRLAQQALIRGRKVIFVCDRTTLIHQTSETATRYGLGQHGIIQAQNPRFDMSFPLQIASAQTLARRGWPNMDGGLVLIDEAHTQLSTWTEFIMQTSATCIGLTATAFSKGLGKLFTNLVNAGTMHELTQQKVLVPMRVYSCTTPDMRGAETAGGEWTDAAAASRGMAIIGDVVAEWVKFGEGRKTICFGSTIAHCDELCNQFVKAGIMAAVFCSNTPDDERLRLMDEFRKPDSSIRVLISVSALSKGVDVADIGCICDARPMRKSMSEVIQMWGRGLRSHPGKSDLILLDFSGNVARFAEDYTDFFFNGLASLDDGEKLDSTIRKEPEDGPIKKGCPKCGFKPFFRRCMGCGFEIEQAATVEHQPGEMREVQLTKTTKIDKQQLYQECVAYARLNSAPDKQRGRAGHLWKDITGSGDWPPPAWGNVPADMQVSAAVRTKILSLNIRNAKRRTRPGVEA